MEQANEPGSAKFGNFINYYTFNPPERRLQLIPKDLLRLSCTRLIGKENILALDVGCNSGNLTLAIHDHLVQSPSCDGDSVDDQVNVLGIDLDPVLIERANETLKHSGAVSFAVADIMKDCDRSDVIQKHLLQQGQMNFDIIFLFSVTMWIHLNNGDEGLKKFLRYVSSIATYLLIEPQPWKCYVAAQRRMKKLTCQPFALFDSLKLRETVEMDVVKFLEDDCSMKLIETFGRTDWNRSLLLFESTV